MALMVHASSSHVYGCMYIPMHLTKVIICTSPARVFACQVMLKVRVVEACYLYVHGVCAALLMTHMCIVLLGHLCGRRVEYHSECTCRHPACCPIHCQANNNAHICVWLLRLLCESYVVVMSCKIHAHCQHNRTDSVVSAD